MTVRGYVAALLFLLLAPQVGVRSQETSRKKIPRDAKVFIVPQKGYETFLKMAFQCKQVPLQLVEEAALADYELRSVSETEQAGLAKKIILGNWHSREEASVVMVERKSGEVVFAYSVHKGSSMYGRRSTAEACAKHLKEAIE